MASAQTTTTDRLKIALADGTVITYNVSDIDSMWFEEVAPEVAKIFRVNIPTEFSDSYVFNILSPNGSKIGEVCSEYIRSFGNADTTHTVVYSTLKDEEGNYLPKVTFASCLDATTGAAIAWSSDTDSIASYTPAATEGAVDVVYITADGVILTEAPEGTDIIDATLEPFVITDIRGTEKNAYKIVKIGTQYWMAENLRACYFTSGKAITNYRSTDISAWKADTQGCYHVYADDAESQAYMGVMYNGYAMLNDSIAPSGWTVPETSDFTAMKAYLKSYTGRKLKSAGDYDWATDHYLNTNVTNFGACGDGYFFAAGEGDTGYGTDVYYWTKTPTYDVLTKDYSYGAMRLNYKANSLVSTAYHEVRFGHYIRCIMK